MLSEFAVADGRLLRAGRRPGVTSEKLFAIHVAWTDPGRRAGLERRSPSKARVT
jgi:hypothetical protein